MKRLPSPCPANLRRKLSITRALFAAGAVVLVGSALAAAPAGALQQPYVQIVGCSNSSLVFKSYDYSSTRHMAINSAQAGQSLKDWATEGSQAWVGDNTGRTVGFDANYATYGATMVWYPLCIRRDDYPNSKKAYDGFKASVALLRKRTAACTHETP